MKIYQKLLLGFICVALLVSLVGAIAIFTNNEVTRDFKQLTHSSIEEVGGATKMSFILQTLQLDTLQLLTIKYRQLAGNDTTADQARLRQLTNTIETEKAQFYHWLKVTVRATHNGIALSEADDIEDEKEELFVLDQVKEAFNQYNTALIKTHQLAQTDLIAANHWMNTNLMPLYQQVYQLTRAFEEDAAGELVKEAQEIDHAIDRANQLMIYATLSGFFAAIVLGVFIAQLISRPLAHLKETALKIGAGHLNSRANIQGQDEMADLAESLNKMAIAIEKTSQSLKDSAQYNQNIVQSMQDTLIVLSATGDIQMINRSGLELLGYDESELINQPIAKIIQSQQDDVDVDAVFTRLSLQSVQGLEAHYQTKNAGPLPMLFSGAIMKNQDNKVLGYVCVARDLTERKIAEAKILQTNERLIDTNNELMDTQGQLVQSAKLASVGELATGVAHELNQPLGIIAMYADLRLAESRNENFAEVSSSYQIILKQVDRATVIINHLRTFGRESNKQSRVAQSINQVIENSFILIHEELRLKNINLVTALTDNLMPVHCNSIQIEQVLLNLFMNAKDALAAVVLKKITVGSHQVNDKIMITVEDSGSGISKDVMSKVFDPFFTTKDVGQGTGLGLSISYGIIQSHGGDMSVKSTPGSTLFTITLPVVREC